MAEHGGAVMPYVCSDCGMQGTEDEIVRHRRGDHDSCYLPSDLGAVMRPPPKITQPPVENVIDQMNALAKWMHEAAESITSSAHAERPGSQWRYSRVDDDGKRHPIPEPDPVGQCARCMSEMRKSEWWQHELEHRAKLAHPPHLCPNCTPEQPCDRARTLLGESERPESLGSDAVRQHKRDCPDCYKTLPCDRLRELLGTTADDYQVTLLTASQEEAGGGVWERATNVFHPVPKHEGPRVKVCPDCTPEQPCDRARMLLGEGCS